MNNTYIKVGGGNKEWFLIPLSAVTFVINDANFICSICDLQGDNWTYVYSFSNNDEFSINNFKCQSIEELIVVLDVNNCLYHLDMNENTNASSHISSSNEFTLKKLQAENFKLKSKIKEIEKLLKNSLKYCEN